MFVNRNYLLSLKKIIEVLSVAGHNIWYWISHAFIFIDHRDAIKMDKLDKLRSFIFHIWSFERRTPTILCICLQTILFLVEYPQSRCIHLCVAIIIIWRTHSKSMNVNMRNLLRIVPLSSFVFSLTSLYHIS